MVIPRHSKFRKNIDWLDENFPREVVFCFFYSFRKYIYLPLD